MGHISQAARALTCSQPYLCIFTDHELLAQVRDSCVATLMKKYHGATMVQPWYTTVNSGIPWYGENVPWYK